MIYEIERYQQHFKPIQRTTTIHSYNTRPSSASKLYIKKYRLEIQKRPFSRVGAKIWNEMRAS